MKKALLVVHSRIFFPRMLEFGRMLLESGHFEPMFHFAYKTGWGNLDQDVALLEGQRFKISKETKMAAQKDVSSDQVKEGVGLVDLILKGIKPFFHILPQVVRKRFSEIRNAFLANNFFIMLIKIRRRLSEVRRIFYDEKADIIIIAMDVPTWDTGVFIRAARLEKIPTVVAFSQTGPLDEASYVYSQMKYLSTKLPWNYLLGKIYPKWVCKRNNKSFLMMRSGLTLAKEISVVSMPQPWIESSSHADAVLIESEAYLQRGLSVGLKADNLFLTGLPFHDFLYSVQAKDKENLSRVYSLHGLMPGKPIVLTSLLPKYHDRDNSGPEFQSYEALVEFWIRSLTSYDQYHTILSLHPTQKYSDYSYLEKWGVKITRMLIPEIMPLCHLFVASLTSTITMAVACKRPVINYDFAGYASTHYDNAPGVLKVENKREFEETLNRLLCDQSYYQDITLLQRDQAKKWGVLDGHAGERIVGVMNNLVGQKEGGVLGIRTK